MQGKPITGGRRLRVLSAMAVVAVVGSTIMVPAKAASKPNFDPNGILRVGNTLQQVAQTNFDPRITSTPNDIAFTSPLYAPIMTWNPKTNQYKPFLAESVTVVDPTTIKVVLRSGITFDNGAPVTANDAKATMETLAANVKAAKANAHQGVAFIAGVDVIDTRTYQIRTTVAALGVIYELLVGSAGFIVPASAGAEQNTRPIGTGAFKFVSHTVGQKVVYEKSTTYFDAKNVNLKGLEILNLKEGTPQANALLAGDIDLTSGVAGGLDIATYQSVKKNAKTSAAAFNAAGFMYLAMCKTPNFIFSNPLVRQAIEYGTNRAEMAAAVTQGLGAPAFQFWPEGSPNYNPKVTRDYKYNPTKAKKLLKEAGVAEGTSIDIVQYNALPAAAPSALILKDQWAKIGLNVNVVTSSDIRSDFNTPAQRGTLKIPGNVTQFVRTSGQMMSFLLGPTSANNICTYRDPAMEALITETNALRPTDPKSATAWAKLSVLLAEQNPVMPLLFLPTTTGWSKRIGGVSENILGRDGLVATRYDLLYVKSGK